MLAGVNYYPLHIGDYLRDTAHLSALEDGIYHRMLSWYYASEKPLPLDYDWICRMVRARSSEEREAVELVLREFFQKKDDGWHNKRANEEIRKARKRIKAARDNGKLGGKGRTHRVPTGLPLGSQNLALQKPNTKSQKPKEEETVETPQRSRGSRLPPGWYPPESLTAWAGRERPDLDLKATIASFRDYWISVPGTRGTKLDWDATFRNWVRSQRAGKTATPDYSAVFAKLEDGV